jgi:hypothetical protein
MLKQPRASAPQRIQAAWLAAAPVPGWVFDWASWMKIVPLASRAV